MHPWQPAEHPPRPPEHIVAGDAEVVALAEAFNDIQRRVGRNHVPSDLELHHATGSDPGAKRQCGSAADRRSRVKTAPFKLERAARDPRAARRMTTPGRGDGAHRGYANTRGPRPNISHAAMKAIAGASICLLRRVRGGDLGASSPP
jgi:hypothetical protein